jgi:secretion/DNA translocation related CpaE-like protein
MTSTVLASTDPIMIDHVRTLALAGGEFVEVIDNANEIAKRWPTDQFIVLGAEMVSQAVGLPKRRNLAIVHWQYGALEVAPSQLWQSALLLGAEHVVALPEGDAWLAERLTESMVNRGVLARLLIINGSCGGSGASTLAAGLAVAAERLGKKVLLIDGDINGGGLDLLLGAEASPGARWPELVHTSGRVSTETLLPALPSPHNVALISAARKMSENPTVQAWQSVINFGRNAFDVVLIDMPRHQVLDKEQWCPTDLECELWCVVPTRIRAVAAAAVALEHYRHLGMHAEVLVRQTNRSMSAGDISRALGAPVRAVLPEDSSVSVAAELGELAGGSYAKACTSLFQEWWK